MPPKAKGATAEGFPTSEQRPAVRRDTRPEDRNEAPRGGAGEHGGERPEGEGLKEHPQTLPDRPATNQPPIARCRISRGGIGGSRAPPYGRANTYPGMAYPTMSRPAPPPGSGRNPPSRKRTRGKACGKTDPPARLTRRKEAGRTATTTSGRAGGGTHGVRTYTLPPSGVNVCGFAVRRNEGARHPARPLTK